MTPGHGEAFLLLRRSDGPEERLVIEREVALIGRDVSCDVVLDSMRVSRRHAAIRRVGVGWTVQDLGSTNGTMLNDNLLDNAPTPLTEDDTITVSPYEIRLSRAPSE